MHSVPAAIPIEGQSRCLLGLMPGRRGSLNIMQSLPPFTSVLLAVRCDCRKAYRNSSLPGLGGQEFGKIPSLSGNLRNHPWDNQPLIESVEDDAIHLIAELNMLHLVPIDAIAPKSSGEEDAMRIDL